MTNLDSIFKSRDMTLPTKVCLVKAMVFPVVMYGCESWTIKKAEHRRIDAFELWCWRRLLRVPWTTRRSNQSILKEISPEFIWRTDVEAETPVLWPPDVKSWLIGKDPDAGKDWRQEEKGTTEDEMAGWHHWHNGRESEWTPGVGDGQGGLACCGSWGCKESDTSEWLNWTIYELPCWLNGKESTCNAGDTGDGSSIPGWGTSPGEGNGTHSSTFAWETPWIVERAVLQLIGSQVSDMIQPQNIYEVDSKELRYSPGNSTQYSIMTYVGMSGHTYNWFTLLYTCNWHNSVNQLSTQSCSTLQPHGRLCPWDFPGENTGVGCHSLLLKLKKKRWVKVV